MYAREEPYYLEDLSDADLIHRLQRGDDDALETLLRRHSEALYRFCCHLAPSREDAEDICQESLTRALGRANSLRSGVAFRTWLFRIARNLSIDSYRSRRKVCPLPDEDITPLPLHADGPHDRFEAGEERQTVAEALRKLAASHQRVLMLREVEGLSYADIARHLDISQSAVETLLFRARRRLREEYGKSEAVPAVAFLAGLRGLLGRLAAPLPIAAGPPLATKVAVTAMVVGGAFAAPHVLSSRHHSASRVSVPVHQIAHQHAPSVRRQGAPSVPAGLVAHANSSSIYPSTSSAPHAKVAPALIARPQQRRTVAHRRTDGSRPGKKISRHKASGLRKSVSSAPRSRAATGAYVYSRQISYPRSRGYVYSGPMARTGQLSSAVSSAAPSAPAVVPQQHASAPSGSPSPAQPRPAPAQVSSPHGRLRQAIPQPAATVPQPTAAVPQPAAAVPQPAKTAQTRSIPEPPSGKSQNSPAPQPPAAPGAAPGAPPGTHNGEPPGQNSTGPPGQSNTQQPPLASGVAPGSGKVPPGIGKRP